MKLLPAIMLALFLLGPCIKSQNQGRIQRAANKYPQYRSSTIPKSETILRIFTNLARTSTKNSSSLLEALASCSSLLINACRAMKQHRR